MGEGPADPALLSFPGEFARIWNPSDALHGPERLGRAPDTAGVEAVSRPRARNTNPGAVRGSPCGRALSRR